MSDVSSWQIACMFYGCPNQRYGMYVPLCLPHLLDAWRFVETSVSIRPPRQPEPERTPPEVARDPALGVVYYIQFPNGRIKIGTSTDVKARALSFSVRWPDAVAAVEWGGREREAERHAQFVDDRRYSGASSTEEFEPSPAVLAHIAAIRSAHGDPVDVWREQMRKNRERGWHAVAVPDRLSERSVCG